VPDFTNPNGTIYSTIKQLGNPGSEGTAYTLAGHPNSVAKILNLAYRTNDREAKLQFLLKKQFSSNICAPQDILYKNNQFTGFVMPFAAGTPIDMMRSHNATHVPLMDVRVEIAIRLCDIFLAVHQAGLAIGDLNAGNILVVDNTSLPDYGRVTLIDFDSVHINAQMRTVVARPEYAPPEVIPLLKEDTNARKKVNGKLPLLLETTPNSPISPETDNFGLAVHIFWLLMMCHPFKNAKLPSKQVKMPDYTEAIMKGITPFFTSNNNFKIPPYAQPLSLLSKEMNDIFCRAFVDSRTKPKSRPTSLELKVSLENYLQYIRGNNTASTPPPVIQNLRNPMPPQMHHPAPMRRPAPLSTVAPVTARPLPPQLQSLVHPSPPATLPPPPPIVAVPTVVLPPPNPYFYYPAQVPLYKPTVPSYSGFCTYFGGDFIMFFSNTILPYLTGWYDRRKYKDVYDDLNRQADTYKITRERLFERRQERLLRCNLRNLKRAVGFLDEKWLEFGRRIGAMTAEVQGNHLIDQATKNAELDRIKHTTSISFTDGKGRRYTLNLTSIQKDRRKICDKANIIIGRSLQRVQALQKTFDYQLEIYLRALNRNQKSNLIHKTLDIQPNTTRQAPPQQNLVYDWNPDNIPPYYN